jgi:hypothetical protein
MRERNTDPDRIRRVPNALLRRGIDYSFALSGAVLSRSAPAFSFRQPLNLRVLHTRAKAQPSPQVANRRQNVSYSCVTMKRRINQSISLTSRRERFHQMDSVDALAMHSVLARVPVVKHSQLFY